MKDKTFVLIHQNNYFNNIQTHTGAFFPKMSTHKGVKYPCDQCDKTFNQQGDLKKHKMLTHKGTKFPCVQYDKRFTDWTRTSQDT